MYETALRDALRALVPPLYYVFSTSSDDALLFTRDMPPADALAVGTEHDIRASVAADPEMAARSVVIHVFGDAGAARAFQRGYLCADNHMRGVLHSDEPTGLHFLAFYDHEDDTVSLAVIDQRDLTPFTQADLEAPIIVSEGLGGSGPATVRQLLAGHRDDPQEISTALRALLDRTVPEVTINYGAGGLVTYSLLEQPF